VLSADLFGRVLWGWNEKLIDPIGQSLEDVAEYVDFISPMLYPSHYAEDHYKASSAKRSPADWQGWKSHSGRFFRHSTLRYRRG